MGKIYAVGVGACAAHLTMSNAELFSSGFKVLLQTQKCYLSDWLSERGIEYEPLDGIYERSCDFNELQIAIAEHLVNEALGSDIVYAMVGNSVGMPVIREISRAIKSRCSKVDLRVLPGVSFAQAALACAADREGFSGKALECFAHDINRVAFDVYTPLCVQEIDNSLRAGEVKLALMEYYPPETELLIAQWRNGRYELMETQLTELDRQRHYNHMTCAMLPELTFECLERYGLNELEQVVATLRAPGGCPWDREQTHKSIRKDLIEEAYELAEAIDLEDDDKMCEELGDLLMQVAFHASIASEHASFSLRDITTGICKKLIYRHPHVYSNIKVDGTDEVLSNWEDLKRAEKDLQTTTDAMEAVCKALPALMRAQKLQKKASKVGFDWDDPLLALDKVIEEERELRAEIMERVDRSEGGLVFEELGDLLFSAANVARLLGLESEAALMAANEKFMRRFSQMEKVASTSGRKLETMSLEEKEMIWQQVKYNQ